MNVIDLIIYITIAISGTVFGSFFTLAVHRIPKHQDITHERSYCPKCNHKLQFLDLIPVFSYIFLVGKCRYCKEKIRPRYLILELCSGLFFFLLAFHRGLNFFSRVEDWVFFCLAILFAVCMFITAGIDKELHAINDGVMVYGSVIGVLKLIALVVFDKNINYHVLAFSIIVAIWALVKIISLKKQNSEETNKFKYPLKLLRYLSLIGLFFGAIPTAFGLVWLIPFVLGFYALNKKVGEEFVMPVAFLMTIVYSLVLLIL